MSARPLEVQAAPAPSKREQLLALTRSGLRLFIRMVPSLVGAGLLGALKGVLLFGGVGLGVGALFVLLPRLTGLPPVPLWLELLGFTAPDASTAVRNVEDLGIERLELALADTLEDLFFVQRLLALTAGVLVSASPVALRLLLY